MAEPLVQIIIPVYNAEKYLRRCLDSVRAQTFAGWQAILVDDASSDGSPDIIREYAERDPRFVYRLHGKNSGAAAARNTALALISSEYVTFLDADDYWERETLEVMTAEALKSGCDVVQCRFVYDFPGGKTALPKGAFPSDVELRGPELKRVYIKMMTGINMNHVCMKLMRASVVEGLSFDASLKTAEDLKFCIGAFARVKSYRFIDRAFYHYVRSEASITGKGLGFAEKLEANRAVSRELVKALPGWGINSPPYRLLSRARPYIIIVSKAFRVLREKLVSRR